MDVTLAAWSGQRVDLLVLSLDHAASTAALADASALGVPTLLIARRFSAIAHGELPHGATVRDINEQLSTLLLRAPETLFDSAEAGLPAFAWNFSNAALMQAFDAAGNASREIHLRFRVLPPWWRSPWGIAAFVALAVLCGVATALAVPLLPPGLPILLAAMVGAAWGWWVRSPDAPSVREEAAP